MRTKDKEYSQLQQLTQVAQGKLSEVTIEVASMQSQLKDADDKLKKNRIDIIAKEEETCQLHSNLQVKTIALQKAEMNAEEIKEELEK